MISHGLSRSPEYLIWQAMRQRCTNPKDPYFPSYGGRGITVQWPSFSAFIADVGRRPDPTLSIERINNDLGYSRENCRWATKTDQSRNTRMWRDNTSGFIGVTLRRRDSRWVAKIKVDKIELWLGSFDSAEAAAAARRQAEQIYWGRP